VLAAALILGFVFGWEPVAPIIGSVLLLGTLFGPSDAPEPPREWATLLVGASVAFTVGAATLGWVLVLVVAAMAGVAAATAAVEPAAVDYTRSPAYGLRPAGMSARRGLLLSRADSTGSASPQSPAISGSSHATPSSSAGL
jgi:hypothetical protein